MTDQSNSPDTQDSQRTFQERVVLWVLQCFGEALTYDLGERNRRFLEESLELVQSLGCSRGEAHQLVDYVYGRPVGEPAQEAGGVLVTLAALCRAAGLDMHQAGEEELARVWTNIDWIREKQVAKPKFSSGQGGGAQWDASQIKQPGWHHVMAAFRDGAREARINPDATDDDFGRAADGYTKRVFEEVDPVSETALRTESWASATAAPSPAPHGGGEPEKRKLQAARAQRTSCKECGGRGEIETGIGMMRCSSCC